MAEFPFANTLTIELEPCGPPRTRSVTSTPRKNGFAHDFVPVRPGRELRLPGRQDWGTGPADRRPSRSSTPSRIPVDHQGQPGWLPPGARRALHPGVEVGRFRGRWTAEEHLHAIALRNYLVVTRNFDRPPTRTCASTVDEQGATPGQRVHPDRDPSGVHGVLRAQSRGCSPAAGRARIEEPTLKALVEHIAADEERHELFFANLVRWCIGSTRRPHCQGPWRGGRRRCSPSARTSTPIRQVGRQHRRGRHLRHAAAAGDLRGIVALGLRSRVPNSSSSRRNAGQQGRFRGCPFSRPSADFADSRTQHDGAPPRDGGFGGSSVPSDG